MSGRMINLVLADNAHPLLLAIQDGNEEEVGLLLRKMDRHSLSDVATQKSSMQPLHLAALYDEPEIMEMILDTLGASAPVDGADAHGRTPLFLAAANSSRECVRILLERG